MFLKNKIQLLLDNRGLTAYKLALQSGVSQATLSRILNSDTDVKVNSSTLKLLSNYFNIDESWFFNEEENIPTLNNIEVIESENIGDNEYLENKNGNKFTQLPNGQYVMTMPVIEVSAQAGLLDNYQNAEYLMDMEQYGLVVDKPAKGRYIAFRVSGHSMDDGGFNAIPDKSIVSSRELQRIHWRSKLRISDFPYWVIYSTQSKLPLLKEIVEHNTEEGYIMCHSLNDSPEFTDFKLNIDDIQALFYVIDVKKNISKKLNY